MFSVTRMALSACSLTLLLASICEATTRKSRPRGSVSKTDVSLSSCLNCMWWHGGSEGVSSAQTIWWAVHTDDVSMARCLLSQGGASASQQDKMGWSLLMQSRSIAMTRLLLKHHADLESKNLAGQTAVVIKTIGHPKFVQVMLKEGAAVCTFPIDGFTRGQSSFPSALALSYLERFASKAPCEAGFYMLQGERCQGLTSCDEGWFCPGYRQKVNVRLPCPSGTYLPHPGAADISQCRPCPRSRPFSDPASPDSSSCRSVPGTGLLATDSPAAGSARPLPRSGDRSPGPAHL